MPKKTSNVKYREWTWTVGSGPNLHWLGSETCPLSSGLCSYTSFKLFIFSQSINYYGLFSIILRLLYRKNVILFYWRNIEIVSGKKKKNLVCLVFQRLYQQTYTWFRNTEKKQSKIQTQGFDVEDLDNRIMIQIKKLFGFSLSVKC